MSDKVVVEFDTEKRSEVPTIGQRKRIKVNGRMETLYVAELVVECTVETWDDDQDRARRFRSYSGTITLKPYDRMER